MLRVFVLLILWMAALSTANDVNMGMCNCNVSPDSETCFSDIALENIGRWEWKWITKTNNTKHWGMAHSIIRPTSMKDGEFSCVVYYTSKFGYYKIYSQYLIYDLGYGRAHGTAFGLNLDVEIYVLKYEPNKYVYLYFCSQNGNDVFLDYRVVLTHMNCLTSTELQEIEEIEKKYGFDGELTELDIDEFGKAYL